MMEARALPRGTGGPVAPPGPGEVWTVMHMVRWSAAYLGDKGVDSPRLTAELLLAHALGLERLELYLQFDRPLSAPELASFKPLLRRRAGREPLQYILGTVPFRTLELGVDGRVLIPRPETETLLDVLREVAAPQTPFSRALDIGTGSGAIALSLAAESLTGRAVGVDISAEAVALATENARRNGLGESVAFRVGPFFAAVAGETFDLVVSNPPYVPDREWEETEPEVREWEPALALKGGDDGLDVVRPLLAQLREHLAPGGWVALELASPQTRVVAELLEKQGTYTDVTVRDDLTGRPRYVLARRSQGRERASGPEPRGE